MAGVAMIDPATVTTNTRPPAVVIEEMRINNEPAPPDAWDSAIRDPQSAFEIQPGQDNFEIQYTALSFLNPEHMLFKYKLEGADTDWVYAGTRRTAYFSHLPPGDYTFRVIAANADGVWNETGASLRISIVPPSGGRGGSGRSRRWPSPSRSPASGDTGSGNSSASRRRTRHSPVS
jgi:hypothetical protein